MQVSVTFRHMDPTASLKEFASEKAARIEKYLHSSCDAHVVLSVEKYMHQADITIRAHGVMMRGKEKSEDMYNSIDRAVSKIERQVKRYRNKLTSHKPREGVAAKVRLNYLAAEAEPEPELVEVHPQVVESKELDAKPMTVEEAVMQMDLLDNDFLVFVNATSGGMNVLYRKTEGRFGLIEGPEHSAPAMAAPM